MEREREAQARADSPWLDAVTKFLLLDELEARLFAATMVARTAVTQLKKRYLAKNGATKVCGRPAADECVDVCFVGVSFSLSRFGSRFV
mgnify:CR=1 FL=1